MTQFHFHARTPIPSPHASKTNARGQHASSALSQQMAPGVYNDMKFGASSLKKNTSASSKGPSISRFKGGATQSKSKLRSKKNNKNPTLMSTSEESYEHDEDKRDEEVQNLNFDGEGSSEYRQQKQPFKPKEEQNMDSSESNNKALKVLKTTHFKRRASSSNAKRSETAHSGSLYASELWGSLSGQERRALSEEEALSAYANQLLKLQNALQTTQAAKKQNGKTQEPRMAIRAKLTALMRDMRQMSLAQRAENEPKKAWGFPKLKTICQCLTQLNNSTLATTSTKSYTVSSPSLEPQSDLSRQVNLLTPLMLLQSTGPHLASSIARLRNLHYTTFREGFTA